MQQLFCATEAAKCRVATHNSLELPPQVDDAIGEMLAVQYEELLDSQAVLERRLQATVDGMADGQRQAAALVAEAAAKAEELALAQEILRVRQDWREPRGVIRPARSR